jgi:hypothetical protein
MSDLSGTTIKDFKDMLERMRSVYPFRDEETKIVTTYDPCSREHEVLQIKTRDQKTGVYILMSSVEPHNSTGGVMGNDKT